MLSYELCKKLKDAGFPQKNVGDYIAPDGEVIYSGDWNDFNTEDCVDLPTLSELIEACGDGFWSLNRTLEGTWFVEAMDWCETVPGNTAEEAVANLYLALHGSKRPD